MSESRRSPAQEKIIELFDKIPFFESFSTEEKIKFSNIDTHIIDFDKDECIIGEGEMDSSLYILLKGDVCITKDITPDLKIAILKPGAIFGEISFLAETPRTANVIADSNVMALRLDRVILAWLGAKLDIKVRDKLMKILVAKLDKMNQMLIDLAPKEDKKYLR